MNRELRGIRDRLEQMSEAEATRLFRLAWRMEEHGCSKESVMRCREEANALHMNPYPERLLKFETEWEFAFRG